MVTLHPVAGCRLKFVFRGAGGRQRDHSVPPRGICVRRVLPFVYFALLAAAGFMTAHAAGADEPPAETTTAATATITETVAVERLWGRHGVRYWHRQARRNHLEARRLRRVLRHDGTVVEAINLACVVYGHCAELWRKATCESRLYAGARNASGASGLFQFLVSTWRTTPYARFSVWSPYANALAAGWMHARGRGGEWACR